MHDFQGLVDYVANNAAYAYALTLVACFLEALPVAGAFVPGSAIFIAIAALVPLGGVHIWPLLIAAIVGGLLGDALPYWAGRRNGVALLSWGPIARHSALVDKSRKFVEQRGVPSVFLARFTPGLRGFVPLLAGTLGMQTGRFYLANVVSAIAWSVSHLLIGLLIGTSAASAGAKSWRLLVLVIVLIAVGWALVRLLGFLFERGIAGMAATEVRVRLWADKHDHWPARILAGLMDPERPLRSLAIWGAVIIFLAWVFTGITEDVVTGDPIVQFDQSVYAALQSLRAPVVDAIMITASELGDSFTVTFLTLAVLAYFLIRRAWWTAGYWVAVVGFGSGLNTLIKSIVQRTRPGDMGYAGPGNFSFPSGHSSVNAMLYGALAFLIARKAPERWRLPIFAAALLFAFLIAFSRIYLGAHWFSDVAASLTLAAAWVIALSVVYARRISEAYSPKMVAGVAAAALIVGGGYHIYQARGTDISRYAHQTNLPKLTLSEWEATGWQKIDARRLDFTGETEEPITLQWAGSIDALRTRLENAGWQAPKPWGLGASLNWLSTDHATDLPVVPSLNAGQLPALVLTQPIDGDPKERLVFQAWSADVEVENKTVEPLWIGAVTRQTIMRPLALISYPTTSTDLKQPPKSLSSAFPNARIITRPLSASAGAPANWNGEVILATAP